MSLIYFKIFLLSNYVCTNNVNLKHCIAQKFIVIVIKAAHRRINLLKTLISKELFACIGLRKTCFKIPRIFNRKNFICILAKNLVNIAMRMDEAFYYLFMYLYNENVLEYAQIARSWPKSMIRDIEGLSNNYYHELPREM